MPDARPNGALRFAQRTVRGRDDQGRIELVTIWIERREGARWTVMRACNVTERENVEPRGHELVFEGYEMGDALEAANAALDADLAASADVDDHNADVEPFHEEELRRRLERWFFEHA